MVMVIAMLLLVTMEMEIGIGMCSYSSSSSENILSLIVCFSAGIGLMRSARRFNSPFAADSDRNCDVMAMEMEMEMEMVMLISRRILHAGPFYFPRFLRQVQMLVWKDFGLCYAGPCLSCQLFHLRT